MSQQAEGMPFLESLGLSVTTRCPVACSHCIVEAGPRRTEEMSAEDVGEWLRQAARLS
jgi:MoaA/NifB/PqqE/SkfB family radical SAM enzyme